MLLEPYFLWSSCWLLVIFSILQSSNKFVHPYSVFGSGDWSYGNGIEDKILGSIEDIINVKFLLWNLFFFEKLLFTFLNIYLNGTGENLKN